ncbi:MAG: nucleotidyltransferase domain-containing protein [Planctomycetota bacterium]
MRLGPNAIIPVGTKVVTRCAVRSGQDRFIQPVGTVGVVTKAPLDHRHGYRIRLVNGVDVGLRRNEFVLLGEAQDDVIGLSDASNADFDLHKYIIYKCVIGSQAYGLVDEGSDIDRRGVLLPSADAHWSIFGVPEQLENEPTQECYWELQKFLLLGLKANPNILECMFTPIVEHSTPLADEMLSLRGCFVSKLIYQTYNGYVLSQFKKLGQDVRNRGEIKWKHAMHLIRLLHSGVAALQTGVVPVRVEQHRDKLLAIRRGQMAWDEVEQWRLSLHAQFEESFANCSLPERPDYDRVNAFLVRARRSQVQ